MVHASSNWMEVHTGDRTSRRHPTKLSKRSKTNGHTAHDVLWRTHNLQFVVDGGFEQIFLKQVSNRDDHLPLRRGEVEKRQRLTHLDVEPRSKSRPTRGGIGTGETRIQLVDDEDVRIEPWHLALDRGRQVVQLLELPADDRRHHQREARRSG